VKKAFLVSALLHVAALAWLARGTFGDAAWDPQREFANLNERSLRVRTLSPEQVRKELKDALEKQQAQIVAGDDQIRTQRPLERKGRAFLSKRDQVVDHETRAPRVGKFRNVLREGLEGSASAPPKEQSAAASGKRPVKPGEASPAPELASFFQLPLRAEDKRRDREALGDTAVESGRLRQGPGRAPASAPPAGKKGEGYSATEDYLKDIAVGANTLLTTREFKYYSFYERIREKLSHAWHLELNAAFEKLVARKRSPASEEQSTRVQIQLDPNGGLVGAQVLAGSGFEELDDAALAAFKRAAPFPNPPRELLDSSHRVVIKWDFVVVADPDTGVQVRVRQSQF
jgi:TonB family protein